MTDDNPITLAEACEIVFKNTITPATLRAEQARGRVDIFRIGKRGFTTLRSVRAMVEKCRVEDPRHAFTSTQDANNGLSETQLVLSARASLERKLDELKRRSRVTSRVSTDRKKG
jgi:hypothetical protein